MISEKKLRELLQEHREKILIVIPGDLAFGFAGEDIPTAKYLIKHIDFIEQELFAKSTEEGMESKQ